MLPRPSAWFVRTALVYQVLGFGLGAYALAGGPWPTGSISLVEAHVTTVLMGFALQLAMGVAYAVLPRRRGSRGDPRLAWVAYGLVNAGILCAVVPSMAPGQWAWRALGQLAIVGGAGLFSAAVWRRARRAQEGVVRGRSR